MNEATNLYRWGNIVPLAHHAHQQAEVKGFWEEAHPEGHYLMLVITELSEAVEADRKGKWGKLSPDTIDTLDGLDGAPYTQAFLREVKDTVEDEIADACIRLLDLLGSRAVPKANVELFPLKPLKDLPLTLHLLEVCKALTEGLSFYHRMVQSISLLRAVSERYEFDLMTHIRLKLKYNATRPALHGKKY